MKNKLDIVFANNIEFEDYLLCPAFNLKKK